MTERDGAGSAAEGEFRRGWPIVLSALLGIGCGLAAVPFYTLGVFAPHLAREFGWSMGQIMGALTITTLALVVAGPIAGALCDRHGTRPVALVSLTLFGLSYLSLALLGGSLVQYYLTFLVIAFVGVGTLPITFTRTVNRWFERNRGLALGLAMMGTGLFGIVCKPVLAAVIAAHGWRAGFLALGALPLVVALPACFALFREPGRAAGAGGAAEVLPGLTRAEALRSWRFWLIAVVLLPISFALAGTVPNLEGILTDRGFTPATIVRLTPLIGLASIIGRLVGGWLLDRFWAPAVAFVILGMPAVSCVLLSAGGLQPGTGALAIVLIGFALGIEYDIVAYLTARYFGMRAYAAIYSLLYTCFAVGAGFAPLVFGMIRDRAQDYAPALLLAAVMLPVCSAAFLLLGRYPVAGTRQSG
ncbi:MFS transporter [Novosphingobium piscinae]|uniref:MFS transporter n=1 Tax=Novosphingobium piscinae TaxID=1507448 RepID=A0A7X1G0S9_9SPHN|nr:MFS transporter [Novosphingobium piscinae]MBC2669892.1 MFS transporter [Novosphingobium piscinae]